MRVARTSPLASAAALRPAALMSGCERSRMSRFLGCRFIVGSAPVFLSATEALKKSTYARFCVHIFREMVTLLVTSRIASLARISAQFGPICKHNYRFPSVSLRSTARSALSASPDFIRAC